MERESSVSRETVQYRQCRKVAEEQDSRILREQCKDVSSRKHSTTHEKVEDSLSSATVPTPRSAANPVPTTQTASSAKRKNWTPQTSREEENFGDKVIKDA